MASGADPNVIREYFRRFIGRDPTPAELQGQVDESKQRGENNDSFIARVLNHFKTAAPMGGGGGEEFEGFESMMDIGELLKLLELPGPSEAEQQYLAFLTQSIQEQLRIQGEENARVQARRNALDARLRKAFGIGLDEFEAEEAFRAASISRQQSMRLEKALAGKLPVDPALERQIAEDEKTVRSKLLEQVGPGFEQSSPGIESLADFRQRAEELRSAARHDEIAQGISPAASSAQYGLGLIGAEGSIDTTGIAQGLQFALGQRQAGLEASRIRATGILGLQDIALRDRLGMLNAALERERNAISRYGIDVEAGSRGVRQVIPTGSGYGNAAGFGVGAAAPYIIQGLSQRRRYDPFYT